MYLSVADYGFLEQVFTIFNWALDMIMDINYKLTGKEFLYFILIYLKNPNN